VSVVENPTIALQSDYLFALRQGSGRLADRVVTAALEQGMLPGDIYLDIFQKTAYAIGVLWQHNEVSVAQEHLATAIIERQMGELHPLFRPQRTRSRSVIIGAVEEELHRVGARMVADFFEQDGWEVLYLGATVPTDTLICMARDLQADLVGVSAQMAYHVPAIQELVRQADRRGLGGLPIMAGGYPFVQNPGLYQKLGLRFSGANARQAVELANRMIAAG
jgi:MerR family transcriptional regulator, light-induced transcriptional regulator